MALKLYNTLVRRKEIFKPLKKGKVSLYYCGPTVYWTQHIGNLRGLFCADTVVRTLRYLGYEVKSVRNYTDVGHLTGDNLGDADAGEDKIEQAARKENLSPQEIANKYIAIYEQDAKDLNMLEPTAKPRATECVPEMIDMIQTLSDKGYAYPTDLAVYFDVSKAKNYTRLSGQKIEEQIKGGGKGKIDDQQKKHPADFALWFFKAGQHQNALQYWPSPFQSSLVKNGEGFPGWHIECSVMSKKFLGETIDIHMGGREHIPVHHTNEIAQSEAANGVKFVNYWLHNEHLLANNKKMSKSAGAGYTLAEVKAKGFSHLALRYLFLQAHYRSKQNFTWEIMTAAQNGFARLISQVKELGDEAGQIDQKWQNDFIAKISDDFNLPQALAVAQNLLKSDLNNQDKLATLLNFDEVLGLGLDKLEKIEIPQWLKDLAEKREKARRKENWSEADEIRKEIERQGYQIEDTDQGPKLSPR